MAIQFQINIDIQAGAEFSREFSLKNPDQSPVDISGYTMHAKLAKHQTAQNAVTSTSDAPVYKYISFTSTIVDGPGGVYSISLDAATTAKLQEGKYVYSIVMENGSGDLTDTADGLAFVKVAFGHMASGGSLDPNYP